MILLECATSTDNTSGWGFVRNSDRIVTEAAGARAHGQEGGVLKMCGRVWRDCRDQVGGWRVSLGCVSGEGGYVKVLLGTAPL